MRANNPIEEVNEEDSQSFCSKQQTPSLYQR